MTQPYGNRDKEKDLLVKFSKNSVNTFVFGSHGIGKTTLIKQVAEEYNSKVGQAFYIDCSIYNTANAIMREILTSIGSVIASKSNYDLTKRLKEKTRKGKFAAFLDHFENLKDAEILNILFGLNFGLVLISDTFESYRSLDLSLKSRIANVVKIEDLPKEQSLEIIKENAKPSISDEKLQQIAEKSQGNLDLALNIVRTLETNGQSKAIEQLDPYVESLSNTDQELILQILRQSGRLSGGEAYRQYCQRANYPKCERAFRNYMHTLIEKGFVKSVGEKRGRVYEAAEAKSDD